MRSKTGTVRAINVVGTLFRLLSFLLIGAGVGVGVYTALFVSQAVPTEGEVVQLDETEHPSPLNPGARRSRYHAVVRFEADDGESYTVRARQAGRETGYMVGETVPVRYWAGSPDRASIDDTWEIWGSPVILGALGLAFLVVGLVAPKGFRRKAAYATGSVEPDSAQVPEDRGGRREAPGSHGDDESPAG